MKKRNSKRAPGKNPGNTAKIPDPDLMRGVELENGGTIINAPDLEGLNWDSAADVCGLYPDREIDPSESEFIQFMMRIGLM